MKDSEEATSETTVVVNVTAPEGMFLVEGGTFMMGSNEGGSDERPVHEVSVDSFYISRHEVTNAEYCDFLNAKWTTTGVYEGNTVTWVYLNNDNYCGIEKVGNEFKPKGGKENYPVIEVTWYGANAYAEWKKDAFQLKRSGSTQLEGESKVMAINIPDPTILKM